MSDLPDGVYRTDLSFKRLFAVGLGPSNAGLWTLTIKEGTYELDCRHTAEPGVDCGNSDPQDTLMEIGTVHGSAPTVWFVHDMALKEKLTGCTPGSQAQQDCGGVGGYHLDWKLVPGGIEFSNFVGLGDEASEPALSTWTAQPWTKIS